MKTKKIIKQQGSGVSNLIRFFESKPDEDEYIYYIYDLFNHFVEGKFNDDFKPEYNKLFTILKRLKSYLKKNSSSIDKIRLLVKLLNKSSTEGNFKNKQNKSKNDQDIKFIIKAKKKIKKQVNKGNLVKEFYSSNFGAYHINKYGGEYNNRKIIVIGDVLKKIEKLSDDEKINDLIVDVFESILKFIDNTICDESFIFKDSENKEISQTNKLCLNISNNKSKKNRTKEKSKKKETNSNSKKNRTKKKETKNKSKKNESEKKNDSKTEKWDIYYGGRKKSHRVNEYTPLSKYSCKDLYIQRYIEYNKKKNSESFERIINYDKYKNEIETKKDYYKLEKKKYKDGLSSLYRLDRIFNFLERWKRECKDKISSSRSSSATSSTSATSATPSYSSSSSSSSIKNWDLYYGGKEEENRICYNNSNICEYSSLTYEKKCKVLYFKLYYTGSHVQIYFERVKNYDKTNRTITTINNTYKLNEYKFRRNDNKKEKIYKFLEKWEDCKKKNNYKKNNKNNNNINLEYYKSEINRLKNDIDQTLQFLNSISEVSNTQLYNKSSAKDILIGHDYITHVAPANSANGFDYANVPPAAPAAPAAEPAAPAAEPAADRAAASVARPSAAADTVTSVAHPYAAALANRASVEVARNANVAGNTKYASPIPVSDKVVPHNSQTLSNIGTKLKNQSELLSKVVKKHGFRLVNGLNKPIIML